MKKLRARPETIAEAVRAAEAIKAESIRFGDVGREENDRLAMRDIVRCEALRARDWEWLERMAEESRIENRNKFHGNQHKRASAGINYISGG